MVCANSAPGKQEDENADAVLGLNVDRPGAVPAQAIRRASISGGSEVGILGLIVVTAILSLSAYFIVRYLL